MRLSIGSGFLLATVASLVFSSWLPTNDAASAGQGKGGEVIAKPTPTPAPKKTTTSKKPPPRNSKTNQPAKSANEAATAAEMIFWNSIKDSTNPDDFKVYLKKFPNGEFVELAQNRLKILEPAKSSPSPTSENPNPKNPSSTNPGATSQSSPSPGSTSPDASTSGNTKPSAPPSGGATESAEDAPVHWKRGEELQRNRKYPEAEAEYRQALKLAPNEFWWHYSFASFLQSYVRKFDEAEAEYRLALRLNPSEARAPLVWLLQKEHRWSDAEVTIREGLNLKGFEETGRWLLGDVLSAQGRWSEAQAEYSEALRLCVNRVPSGSVPTFTAICHSNYAGRLKTAQKYVEAEAEEREALRWRSPSSSLYHRSLAEILELQKKSPEAEAEYREALSLVPDNDVASLYEREFARFLTEQNRLAEAEALLENGLGDRRGNRSDYSYGVYGQWLMEQKRWTEAESALREALRLYPSWADSYSKAIGDALAGQNKLAEAETEYRRAMSAGEWDKAHIGLASCLERENKSPAAESEYKAAVQWDPFVASNRSELGDFYMRQKRFKEAAAAYQEAVRLEPRETKYQEKLQEATKAQTK